MRQDASWLIDMDGVLVREEHPIEGANRFLDLLRKNDTPFLVLTNNSMFTRRDLCARLKHSGLQRARGPHLDVRARDGGFPRRPAAKGSAYVIGERTRWG